MVMDRPTDGSTLSNIECLLTEGVYLRSYCSRIIMIRKIIMMSRTIMIIMI